ncbi:hypothetical protein GOBAR_DD28595 [Gossypium barbadense]|nr:hypothetical protein GOBAR_DD28595 [Gossypium barbadense]
MIDLSSEQPTSWKDKLVNQSSKDVFNGSERKEDLDIWDGDIQKSIMNGVNSGPTGEKKNALPGMTTENRNTTVDDSEKKDGIYGPWMIVERKLRRKFRENVQNSLSNQESEKEGSCFRVINNRDLYKDVYEGDFSNSRRSKWKEIMNGNFLGKDSASHYNGRIELSKRNNNKGKLKEVVSIVGLSPIIKENVGPNLEPRSNLNSINENLQVTKESINCLGLGDSPDVQARDLLDQLVPDSVA